MSDIFREVEEEVRKERLEQLWKQYGDYVVAGVCLIIIGAAGLQLWRTYDERARLKASDQYAAAEAMIENGQAAAAADAFGRLADSAPSGYKGLARLQHADALLASGERGDALGLYKQIAESNDDVLSPIARARWAWAIVDYAPRDQVTAALGPIADPSNAWSPIAREVLAYWDFRSGNSKQAEAAYDALSKDKDAPAPLKERANFMATLIKAGGDKDYGTVPEPPVMPTASAAPSGEISTATQSPSAPSNQPHP